MSGNLWMYSDMLDDVDVEMLQHDFITYYQGADYYGIGLKAFTKMAHEAGAVYKIGKKVLIRREIFDQYLRSKLDQELHKTDESLKGGDELKKQGALFIDKQSGRMDIRFGLEDYYGGLHCGTGMDVLINGEWIPTRIEMGNNWYLEGIQTDNITGMIVRI